MPRHAPWRPLYLRYHVLGAFSLLFTVLIVCLERLLAFSTKNVGLAGNTYNLYYLWTYGPTAIIALIGAFWARVECQTKLIAPWAKMAEGPTEARNSLTLDYLSMFQPGSLIRALQYRDHAVAAATAISIIIRLLIIISTGLITLSPIDVYHSEIPVQLQTEFVDNADRLTANGALAIYALDGNSRLNTPLPSGTSSEYAYPIIASEVDSISFNTTVDGFSAGLNCEIAELSLDTDSSSYAGFNFTLKTANCDIRGEWFTENKTEYSDNYTFGQFVWDPCFGSAEADKDNRRVAITFATVKLTLEDSKNVTFDLLRANSLICTPTYGIGAIGIEQSGSVTQISGPRDTGSRTLSNIHPWDILDTYQTSGAILIGFPGILISGTDVDLDWYSRVPLGMANATPAGMPSLQSLFNPQEMGDFVNNFFQQYAAILVHYSLMQPASIPARGSALVVEDRLQVHSMTTHWMSALLAICILLVLVITYTIPTQLVFPRSPSTLIEMAVILSQSIQFLRILRPMGASKLADLETLLAGWRYRVNSAQSEHFSISYSSQKTPVGETVKFRNTEKHGGHPTVLNPIIRFAAYSLFMLILATLELTLWLSQKHNGLGAIRDDTYLHYLWTVCPTIVFGLIGTYCAAVEFKIRCLTPYAHLRGGAMFRSTIGLDLINRFPLFIIIEEVRSGSYAALFATAAVITSSFLTIFSASLFYAAPVDTIVSATLCTTSLISNRTSTIKIDENMWATHGDDGLLATSLILLSNISYPPFTYEDMIFPGFELAIDPSYDGTLGIPNSLIFINAIVPAVRPRVSCRLYNESQVRTNLTLNTTSPNLDGSYSLRGENHIDVVIDHQDCKWSGNLSIGDTILDEAYFGATHGPPTVSANPTVSAGCSEYFWVWGHWTQSNHADGNYNTAASAMGCNTTLETIHVEVSFTGHDLQFDPHDPPRPVEASAQNVGPVGVDSFYEFLPEIAPNSKDNLDPFFTHLTTSRYAIPIEMLGSSSQAQGVASAIRFQHSVSQAQSINLNRSSLVPFSCGGTSSNLSSPNDLFTTERLISAIPWLNSTREHPATVRDATSGRRVFQDAASTQILAALLAAILLCSIASWLLMRDTKILPRSPTSIASAAALLAGGNLFDYLDLARARARMTDADADADIEAAAFAFRGPNVMFRLGWWSNRRRRSSEQLGAENGDRDEDQEERFAIYLDDTDVNCGEERAEVTNESADSMEMATLEDLDDELDALEQNYTGSGEEINTRL